MLKAMRRNRVLIGFLTVLVIFSMLFFGVTVGNRQVNAYAIKVGETEISHGEFAEQRRLVEARYRKIFGEKFPEVGRSLLKDLNRQLIDKFILESLVESFASAQSMFTGKSGVNKILKEELFPDGFSVDKYRRFLQASGETGASFERRIAKDLLRQQFSGLIEDVSTTSRLEAKVAVEREETTYAVEYIELDPESLSSSIKEPERSVLESYYEDNAALYQVSPRVMYDYVTFKPENFLDLVELSEDDIEFFYSENEESFVLPEQVKASHIQFFFPKDATGEQLLKTEELAKEVHIKAQAGEPFDKLVLRYSDDILTKNINGDLGWLSRGTKEKEFDAAVFKLKDGGISELIQTNLGFQIVKVDGYQPSRTKSLNEVRQEIEKEIRQREAPAYTRVKAEELLETWKKQDAPLSDFAVQQGLLAVTSGGLRSQTEDPDEDLKGLTDKVLIAPNDKRQLADLNDKFVLVEVKEFRDAEFPPLDMVKDKVLAAYRTMESKKAAKEKADGAIAGFKDGTFADMASAAKAIGGKIEKKEDLRRASGGGGIFSDQAVKDAIFSTYKALEKPSRTFEEGGKYYIYQISSITAPDAKKVEDKIIEYRGKAAADNSQILLSAITNRLKAKTEVDFDQGLLGDY